VEKQFVFRRFAIFARNWANALVGPRPLLAIRFLPRFVRDWSNYAGLAGAQKVRWLDTQPCLGDRSAHTPFDAHYYYQGAWLARRMAKARTAPHVDVGSSVLTISVLSAWIDTVFVDYRPLKAALSGLNCLAADILKLPFRDDSVDTLSCLHVIEHIGLGRYGDTIDPDGSIRAALELQRILRPGGKLLLSLPVGRERVCFNAHRVYQPGSVLKMFERLELVEFSFVDDSGRYWERQQPSSANDLQYGCGLFYFEKRI